MESKCFWNTGVVTATSTKPIDAVCWRIKGKMHVLEYVNIKHPLDRHDHILCHRQSIRLQRLGVRHWNISTRHSNHRRVEYSLSITLAQISAPTPLCGQPCSTVTR
ncbi:hypothetical protein TYRP_008608 [Tyrophagus putrescentiae]|nr:hypothetical protein TYRP_008608 [Tyrophagus putrescentiae]